MAENRNYSYMTIQQVLEIVSFEMGGYGTRIDLFNRIGEDMYNKLCALGYITQGATINEETKERIRVWKLTDKLNLFDEIKKEPTPEESRIGTLLAHIGL